MADTKNLETCGFLAIIVMVVSGTIFGVLGVVLAHFLTKYFEDYYVILVFPILLALVLGFGLSTGAKIGKCSRLKVITALVVLVFSLLCYGLLLFLNDYYDQQTPKPATIVDEYHVLAEEIQNFVGELPYISNYIKPVENSRFGNIGTKFVDFIKEFPHKAQETPVVIGTIFDLALFVPVKNYLMYPGITNWDEKGRLIFDENVVKTWMLWTPEFLLVFLIALLMTRSGTQKVYQTRLERFRKVGYSPISSKTKAPKEKKGLFGRKKKTREQKVSAGLDLTPKAPLAEEAPAQPEQKAEKKKFSLFRRKKEAKARSEEKTALETAGEQAATTTGTADTTLEMEFPEDQQNIRYALILHQFDPSRQTDLVWLIQQIGQVSEDQARRLLKVPSLIKRDVFAQDARMAIEKFKQVQAQVKLITMEQLLELQKKQQQAAKPVPPTVQPSPLVATGEKYALILRKFDPSQRKSVLALLSSLSSTPVAQLQQTLKTPALILRDATKDEVTMIAQQFQTLQADVKTLTMADLQKLMAKK